MFDDLSGLAQAALTILALASIAGFGLQRGHTKNIDMRLTEERTYSSGLEKRVAYLETEMAKQRADNAAKDAEIQALQRIKSNEDALQAVSTKLTTFGAALEAHNSNAERHWTTQEAQTTRLIKAVEESK